MVGERLPGFRFREILRRPDRQDLDDPRPGQATRLDRPLRRLRPVQLDQIRQQIELLAKQAQELRKRKELSLMIYDARLSFQPVIGQTYYMYEKKDGNHLLSLVSPKEWGGSGPFKQFISAVKLLADHTWVEVEI